MPLASLPAGCRGGDLLGRRGSTAKAARNHVFDARPGSTVSSRFFERPRGGADRARASGAEPDRSTRPSTR